MLRSQIEPVNITSTPDQTTLSKGQKAFNRLIQQIEKRRTQLAALEAAIPAYRKKYGEELMPLIEQSNALQLEAIHSLDRAMQQKGLTKTERRNIAGLIVELTVMQLEERDDAELKAIYNRHSGADFDAEQADELSGMKDLFGQILGMELNDDLEFNTPEDLLKHAQAELQKRTAEHAAAQQERQSKKKLSAKQLARQAQQQADEQQTSLSIREIYRKLASALHPDRETDPQERERKNALMQRVNQAYAEKKLLQLLELQLEVEHIDQHALNNLSEERLKHYNKILKEQLHDLDQTILQIEDEFCMQFGFSPYEKLTPASIMRDLAVNIAITQSGIQSLKTDLQAFADVKALKLWIKEMTKKAHTNHRFADDCPF